MTVRPQQNGPAGMSSTDHRDPQCPYTLLSVPRDATITEIKRQYRKLALKHHPDKGGDEAIFKEISAAYEVLSDEGRRAEYDHAVEEANAAAAAAAAAGNSGRGGSRQRRSRPPGGRQQRHERHEQHAADPFDHPFFRRGGVGGMHSQNFTDPFDLFERVFGEEFGRAGRSSSSSFRNRPSSSSSRHGSSRTGRHASTTHSTTSRPSSRRDPFDDPFFSSSGVMGGLGARGGGMEGMMSRMSRQMDAMSNMMDMHHRSMGSMMGGTGTSMGGHASQRSQRSRRHGSMLSNSAAGDEGFSSYSVSSSSFGGGGFGGNGRSESTSTTTRIVNGVQETVTERTVIHPDGRMERHVQHSSSNGGGGAISNDRHRRYIDQGRG